MTKLLYLLSFSLLFTTIVESKEKFNNTNYLVYKFKYGFLIKENNILYYEQVATFEKPTLIQYIDTLVLDTLTGAYHGSKTEAHLSKTTSQFLIASKITRIGNNYNLCNVKQYNLWDNAHRTCITERWFKKNRENYTILINLKEANVDIEAFLKKLQVHITNTNLRHDTFKLILDNFELELTELIKNQLKGKKYY
jgi:hypothetical protein